MSTPTPTQTPTIEQVSATRGWQTLVQGLGIDVLVAVAVAVAVLPGAETWADVERLWPAWALLLSKSIVQAVVAWIVRRYADRAGTEIAPRRSIEG